MNQIPKVVFSRSNRAQGASAGSTTTALRDATRVRAASDACASPAVSGYSAEWLGSAVAAGELVEEIGRLKQQAGKDILAHGGARFAQSLVQHALIDEYRLLVHPVALGRGLPLFAALPRSLDLRLVSTAAFAAVSQVTRGENAGHALHEFNIVRSVRKLGDWQGEGETFTVPLTALAADAGGVVVLVQQRDQGPIVGAASRLLR